ncbi:MAG TPA: endo alpha-1,4 polygalactosaminidase [Clostridia bacterium]|nr:endo alpha-1,4 polygalactosaminidase [Clostridia bacterium]
MRIFLIQKKTLLSLVATTLALICVACTAQQPEQTDYGVFLGLNPEDASILTTYKIVVIDAQYFTRDEIAAVQQSGTEVYTYLNIGSIETFREGYDSVKGCILSPYDNWPDEYWVDVSRSEWQTFVAGEAKSLSEKGVDGFFLDNADVSYLYPSSAIYEGLNAILQTLAPYDKPVIINGGDVFVSRAVLDADAPNRVITGVNQECVFTNINFTTGALIRQDRENTEYYQAYLARCKEAGLDVFLTEYAKSDNHIIEAIKDYCEANGFRYYVSPSINLDAN